MISIALYLIYLGLFLFSLILKKHSKEVLSKEPHSFLKNTLWFLGSISLIGSLVLFIKTIGLSLGLTYWFGFLALITIFIALIYTYKPKFIFKISIILLVLSLILILL